MLFIHKYCKLRPNGLLLNLFLLLLCWSVQEGSCQQNQSVTVDAQTNSITRLPIVTPSTTMNSPSDITAMITSTSIISSPPVPTTSPTPMSCEPCIREVNQVFNSLTAVFCGMTALLFISTVVLIAIVVCTCKKMKNMEKTRIPMSAVFPDGTGVSHWISREDIPTLEEAMSQDDKQTHNIWSLSTRPVTFGTSPDNETTATESPPADTVNNPHFTTPNVATKSRKQPLKPKRKAPVAPAKRKSRSKNVASIVSTEQGSPAGYIYPVPVHKPLQRQNSPHVYEIPHAGRKWRLKRSSKAAHTAKEYQGIDVSQVSPPGVYSDLMQVSKANKSYNHAVTQT